MNIYLKYTWIPLVMLSGCTASLQQRADTTDNAESKRLEKRINDLSSTVTLVVNDANRLHNDVEDAKTSGETAQQKIREIESTLRNLQEQVASLKSSPKTQEAASLQTDTKETDVKPPLPASDAVTPADKPESDIQKTVSAEDQMSVAKGFWDAMNAKDIQAVQLYVTRGSKDKLKIKEDEANCKATFGDIKIADDKTTIDTTMQTRDGTTELEIKMQTILVKEDGLWKVDAEQTMMSMFGGAMGEMMKGLGKALEEGFKKGFEEMGKSMADGMQKGMEGMSRADEAISDIVQPEQATPASEVTEKTDITELKQVAESRPDSALPPNQETAATGEQVKVEEAQGSTQETTQSAVSMTETTPPKQETTFISEEAKRELFLRGNIVRLAEAGFPDSKGVQWNILSIEHKAHMTHVEAEPVPATVGYPRFKFVVSFKNPESPKVIGVFCFENGQYSLLNTKK